VIPDNSSRLKNKDSLVQALLFTRLIEIKHEFLTQHRLSIVFVKKKSLDTNFMRDSSFKRSSQSLQEKPCSHGLSKVVVGFGFSFEKIYKSDNMALISVYVAVIHCCSKRFT